MVFEGRCFWRWFLERLFGTHSVASIQCLDLENYRKISILKKSSRKRISKNTICDNFWHFDFQWKNENCESCPAKTSRRRWNFTKLSQHHHLTAAWRCHVRPPAAVQLKTLTLQLPALHQQRFRRRRESERGLTNFKESRVHLSGLLKILCSSRSCRGFIFCIFVISRFTAGRSVSGCTVFVILITSRNVFFEKI